LRGNGAKTDKAQSMAAHGGFLPKRGTGQGTSELARRTGAHRNKVIAAHRGAVPNAAKPVQAAEDTKPVSFFERNKKKIAIGAGASAVGAGGAYAVSKSELFKAKWKYSEDPEKKKGKRAHHAASAVLMGGSAYGGYKMGNEAGIVHATKPIHYTNKLKDIGHSIGRASKTKNFRVGAAVTGAAVAGGAAADHAAKKKDVIVRKDHADSPFLNGEISKAGFTAPFKNIKVQASSFKSPKDKRARALAPYKGGVPKTRSQLPLQARKVSARLDNR
jgi:hypothetical protein